MALTAQGARRELIDNPSRYATEEALLNLLDRVSVKAEGKVTVLYSGIVGKDAFGNEIKTSSLIEKFLSEDADIRVIDNTEASKFIQSREFVEAAQRVFDSDPFVKGTEANHFLYNGQKGAWASISRRFVQETTGEVITLTSHALPDKIFARTEIPAALGKDSRITAINDQSLEFWRDVRKTAGDGEAGRKKLVKAFNASSHKLLSDSGMLVATTSTGQIGMLDSGTLFANYGIAIKPARAEEMKEVASQVMSRTVPAQEDAWREGSALLATVSASHAARSLGDKPLRKDSRARDQRMPAGEKTLPDPEVAGRPVPSMEPPEPDGPFKQKADDFRQLSSKALLEKYPGDPSILDAVAVRETGRKFAGSHLANETDQARFLNQVDTRLAYNLEHGRRNPSPRVLEQREQSTAEEER